jgi:hypothetical protein
MKISPNLIAKQLSIVALFFFTSCSGSYDAEMQKLEIQDNQFCASVGLTPNIDVLLTEIYWRCRIYKMESHTKFTSRIQHFIGYNRALDRLDKKVKIDYGYSYEQWTEKRNIIFDNNDHNLCVMQGYDISTFESTKLEDYLSCRRRLIRDQQIIPPYNKTEYFKRPQDSYSIGFAINKKLDTEIANFNAAKEKYPVCVKFNLRSNEFKTCTIDYDKNRQCLKNVPKLRFKRELAEKVACQKRSYVRFPDSFLKKDDSTEEELRNTRASADLSNNSSFFSIGIDQDQLAKFEAENKLPDANSEKEKAKIDAAKVSDKTSDAKSISGNNATNSTDSKKTSDATTSKSDDKTKTTEKTDDKNAKDGDKKNETTISSDKKISKNFNTREELYTKIDLTRLRQEFAFSCQRSVDPDIKAYGEKLEKDCQDIVQKWEAK